MADPSGDAAGPRPVLVWALAAFHTALLVTLVVAGLYLAGAAGDVLSGLGTAVGVASYLGLWAVTWWTNRRVVAGVGPGLVTGRPDPLAVTRQAATWGGVAGLLFFVGLFVLGAGVVVVTSGLEAIRLLALAGLVGSVLSVAVGSAVGAGFAALDLLLVRAARLLTATDPGPPPAR